MPYINSITEEKTTIGFWKLEEPAERLIKGIDLTDEEKLRFQSFTCERRKREFLASRILLNEMSAGTGKIIYDSHGRPSLKGTPRHISLSHSGSLAAVILSDKPTGIDVEETSRKIKKVIPRFLSEEEIYWVQNSAEIHLTALVCWCAKEAVFKMMPQESVDFRKHIHLKRFEIEPNGSIQAEVENHGKLTGIKLNYRFVENNAVVWCVE